MVELLQDVRGVLARVFAANRDPSSLDGFLEIAEEGPASPKVPEAIACKFLHLLLDKAVRNGLGAQLVDHFLVRLDVEELAEQ